MIDGQLAVPAAVDDAGVLHRAVDMGDVHAPPLRCAGCGAPVEHVAPHSRLATGAPVAIRGHFRLAAGQAHALACPFDFPRAAARIAHAAPGSVHARPGGYLLTAPPLPARRFGPSPPAWRPHQAGTTSAFLAAEAITAMCGFAVLLSRFGGQNAAPGRFAVLWQRRVLAWPEICFDDRSIAALAARLHTGRQPVAAAVLFSAERAGQAKSGASWWLGAASGHEVILDGRRAAIRVTARSACRHALASAELGTQVLVFGQWQLAQAAAGTSRGRQVADVVCWIDRAWQLRPAHA